MMAVIMAGGQGTRLKSISGDIPKPMVPVNGKPVLQLQIENLIQNNVTEIVIIIGKNGRTISDYFGDGSHWNIKITYITEQEPLGTAGALYYLKESVKSDFFLVFGDLVLDIDWERFFLYHKKKSAMITMFAHPNTHPFDSDIIDADSDGKVKRILPKNEVRSAFYHNLTNSGLYVMSPSVTNLIDSPRKIDLEKEVVFKLISSGKIYAYRSTEYIKDMGTPGRFESVVQELNRNIVSARNLKKKQRCIFMDRDGTINRLNGYIKKPEQLVLYDFVQAAFKTLNSSKYLGIIITNQPVLARGECTYNMLEEIHKKLETKLGECGCFIDDLYFCPHHPDSGFPGENKQLKVRCNCRKPNTGMIEKAIEDHNLDRGLCWLIGDTTTDIQTGKNAGLKTILVLTGEKGLDRKYNVKPDYTCENLSKAIELIINEERYINSNGL